MAGGPDLYARVFGSGTPVPGLSATEAPLNDTPEKEELAQQVMKDIAGSQGAFQAWEGPAKEESNYYHGWQWDDADRMRMESLKRPALSFNEIMPVIDAVSGLERLNRSEAIFKTRALDSQPLQDAAGDLATESVVAADELCFVGQTTVRCPYIKQGYRRLYTGPIIEIDLASAKKLTGTPNHPVLTDRGWKALGEVREGDNLVDSRFLERIGGAAQYFNNVESRIEDIVGALRGGHTSRMTTPADFHGDGIGSKVHIVTKNSLLRDQCGQQRLKQGVDTSFVRTHALTAAFKAFYGAVTHCLHSYGELLRLAFNTQQLCFSAGAHLITSGVQTEPYVAGCQPRQTADLRSTESLADVEFDQLRNRQLWRGTTGAQLITGATKATLDRANQQSGMFSDFARSQAFREIKTGEILSRDCGRMPSTVSVTKTTRRHVTNTPVYNVSTECGFYIAEGVLVSNCNADEECSDIAKEMAITGMAWGEICMDYSHDLNGRVAFKKIPSKEMRWDPNSQMPNKEDRKWCARKRRISHKDFEKQYGREMLDKIDAATPEMPYGQTQRYELVNPYYSLANQQANPQVGQDTRFHKDIEVIQYQWRDMQPVFRFVDQDSGEITVLDEDKWSRLNDRMKMLGGAPPPAVKQQKPVYRQVEVSRGVCLDDPVDLPGGFSLLCCTGKWDDEKKRDYGLVRPMIDPQKTKNKAISSALGFHILNAKGGVIFKTSYFTDPIDAKNQWAQPDAWIEAEDSADLEGGLRLREPQQMPQELGMFYSESSKSIKQVSGVNEELVGLATGQTPSQTAGRRVQAGLVVLGWYWDNWNRFKRARARMMLEFIREYWTQGQYISVGGDFNSQAIPLIKDSLPLDYSLVLDDSVRHNPNLKAQVWADLMDSGVLQALMKFGLGQMILKLLKYSPFPTQVVQDIQREAAENPPQQQQKGGRGKQDPPELIDAKVKQMNASAQKAIAQARMIDQQSGLKLAEIVTEGTLGAHKIRAQRENAVQKQFHSSFGARS